jgi:hypothetical protein
MGVRADVAALLKTQGELETWKAYKCSLRFTAMSLERTYKSPERNGGKIDRRKFLLLTAADTLKP